MITNKEFISTLFGKEAPWVHVTDFAYDPNNIPDGRNLASWKGDYFSRYRFGQKTNQYFTISNFYADDKKTARRRIALYRQTPVVVLDDVKEKLSLDAVNKLPPPTWILETSPGSEQWGYLLAEPCTDRSAVENLLDGLVANGLAPSGRDPGMKGVTRYVRLPEGYNTKASKMIAGEPFKCNMVQWSPFTTTTLEALAKPFNVNLSAERRSTRIDGADTVSDHPLLSTDDAIHIKEVRSAGRFDITCPWIDEHTDSNDSGTALFTNGDGSLGFKCHHGACQDRTGSDLLRIIEDDYPGFGTKLSTWQAMRQFADIDMTAVSHVAPVANVPAAPNAPVLHVPDDQETVFGAVLNQLRSEPPYSTKARDIAAKLLKAVDSLTEIDKVYWHDAIRDVMRWSKPEFKGIIKDLRQQWYKPTKADVNFFNDVIFVAEQNQFFNRKKRMFYTPEAYQNAYGHLDDDARKNALMGGMVAKVDRLDYAPKQPAIFEENGIIFGNSWSSANEIQGTKGDASRWLDHFVAMGWGDYKEHMWEWMAHTLVHPDVKINHMLLMGSGEGCGKDFIMYPLVFAMAENHMTIGGEELLDSTFNDYLLCAKHLHINEAELGDKREARAVSNKLKPLAAAPPKKLRVNQKGIKPVQVRNILSLSMTTNSHLPLQLSGPSRRILALWSDLNPRDRDDNMRPEWIDYWNDRWEWMLNGGAEQCIWHLRNCIDLSKFNPAAPPPVTDFLRDIKDSSKSPAQQTIEEFIRHRISLFASDLITVREATDILRAGEIFNPSSMYADGKWFTPSRVSQLLKETGCIKIDCSKNASRARVWVLRNEPDYIDLSSSALHEEYNRQIVEAKKGQPLTIVKS